MSFTLAKITDIFVIIGQSSRSDIIGQSQTSSVDQHASTSNTQQRKLSNKAKGRFHILILYILL